MLYAILIYIDPTAEPTDSSNWFAYTEKAAAAGILRGGEGLQPVDTATTVRVHDGKVLHTDGPFAETKEVLGGFYLFECQDLDEALGWAAQIPSIGYGSVEVRPCLEMSPHA